MAELSDFSVITDNQGRAVDMAPCGRESSEETMAAVEKSPYVPSSDLSPASTAPGFDLEDSDDGQSNPTPPNSSAPTPYNLRNRKQSKLVYDARYHPMDESIRPTQAAKRRSAHGEEQLCFDSDDSSAIYTDAEDSAGEDTDFEDESKQVTRGKKRRLVQSRSLLTKPLRRSSRKTSDPKVSYDMTVHPQDEFLFVSNDEENMVPKKKLKDSSHDRRIQASPLASGAEASELGKRKYDNYVENSTSDEFESDDEHTLSRVENDTGDIGSSPSSSLAGVPKTAIQIKQARGIDSLSPEKRCFHQHEGAWPATPGQPFSIFTEGLSDQLTRDARAASPREYEDDDKENATGNYMDSNWLPSTYGRFSVIPESEFRPSSEERELSSHRALVSHALYDDPPPQTYGLEFDNNSPAETNETSQLLDVIRSFTASAHPPM